MRSDKARYTKQNVPQIQEIFLLCLYLRKCGRARALLQKISIELGGVELAEAVNGPLAWCRGNSSTGKHQHFTRAPWLVGRIEAPQLDPLQIASIMSRKRFHGLRRIVPVHSLTTL
jgi:hypothetical protein